MSERRKEAMVSETWDAELPFKLGMSEKSPAAAVGSRQTTEEERDDNDGAKNTPSPQQATQDGQSSALVTDQREDCVPVQLVAASVTRCMPPSTYR